MSSKPSKLDLRKLATEGKNLATADLDTRPTLEIARIVSAEDAKVAPAVERALPEIARAINAIAESLSRGGRLIYVGAGTSGRIAALDASECPPTFNADPSMVQYVIAGGEKALGRAAEYNEDSRELGRRDLARRKPTRKDVVVGISASGRTPYTMAALEYARSRGARAVAVTSNPGSPLALAADIAIAAEVGPEVVAGSTRMKAGTAQKMILNMLSTGAFTRLGYVYGNLMVNVHLKNEKLLKRGISVLERAAQVDRMTAERALNHADRSVPVALVMLKAGVSRTEAKRRLRAARGNVRRAIAGT
ncbi:MAG TPA: N-acetylmuramic acid 6-phosphate etherase [Terriglobales bacterium]|jgi:N-acetylmuramic acid 6-phosphate etherase|nr:N-acetylmuramic acid 6-phosphate etherase [Terriglobales bacterium]